MTTSLTIRHQGNSSLAGQTHTFQQAIVRLGRRPDNDIAFNVEADRAVSGHHAKLIVEGNRLYLEDLGSQNGTYLDGRQVSGKERILPGQVVRFGEAGPEFLPVLAGDMAPAPDLNAVATPMPGGGQYVGAETLQMAIGTAARQERARMAKLMAVLLGCLSLAGGTTVCLLSGGLGLLLNKTNQLQASLDSEMEGQQSQVDKRLQAYEGELASVKGRVGTAHVEVGKLMQEIELRDRQLKQYATRTDVDKELKDRVEGKLKDKLIKLHAKLEGRLDKMREGASGGNWGALVSKYEHSIMLCVGRNRTGGMAIGTAWVVKSEGILATNAHVVAIFDKYPIRAVIQNKTGTMFKVRRWKAHPKYRAGRTNSPDVGLVEIDPRTETLLALPLAGADELKALTVGSPLGTIGYPGEMMQEYVSSSEGTGAEIKTPKTVATFKVGWIGRIMTYAKTSGTDWTQTRFIQHSASTTGGTSGSPMFNANGNVVALNNSGLNLFLRTGGRVMRVPSAAEINYGIRVDELRDLMSASPDY